MSFFVVLWQSIVHEEIVFEKLGINDYLCYKLGADHFPLPDSILLVMLEKSTESESPPNSVFRFSVVFSLKRG